ncbi:MAG: A/G-specific adenine glycosylase [Nitrosomonadales bacterium]|nr:A/G-specific adenine glycosylase [Nitrosomonadales bacterium]
MNDFATRLIRWQRRHGRNGLPWQGADAYRIWLSEIMLQQTQVATVLPYYQRFVACFPDVSTLAAASEDEVLALWSGLGYYARARNLHRAAQTVTLRHGGKFPGNFDDIHALPGIGRSTAAAISVFAFRKKHAILDGNVKRVLARYFAIAGATGERKIEARLWREAETLLPSRGLASYTQGLMDLGALVCTRGKPQCRICPLHAGCAAHLSGRAEHIPSPRPRKPLPEKYSTFLLLLDGSDILLEKRPATGIWGGLWCPPQMDEAPGGNTCRAQQYGVKAARAHALPAFTHTFTHFRLHITPLLWRVARQPGQAQEPGRMWLNVEEALHAAIPAPVRKLLRQLKEGATGGPVK